VLFDVSQTKPVQICVPQVTLVEPASDGGVPPSAAVEPPSPSSQVPSTQMGFSAGHEEPPSETGLQRVHALVELRVQNGSHVPPFSMRSQPKPAEQFESWTHCTQLPLQNGVFGFFMMHWLSVVQATHPWVGLHTNGDVHSALLRQITQSPY
jgi:hypothetical protein